MTRKFIKWRITSSVSVNNDETKDHTCDTINYHNHKALSLKGAKRKALKLAVGQRECFWPYHGFSYDMIREIWADDGEEASTTRILWKDDKYQWTQAISIRKESE